MKNDEIDRVRRRIRAALEIVLARVAEDKSPTCTADDLSAGVTSAITEFGLECWRLRDEELMGPDERPTKPTTETVLEGLMDDVAGQDHAAMAAPLVPEEFFTDGDIRTPADSVRSKKKRRPPT